MKLGKKGAMGTGVILAVIIGIVLIVGVAIPVTQQTITNSSLTGLTALIVGFVPVFLGIGALVLAAYIGR